MPGEIVTKAPGVQFRKLHPTSSAGKQLRGEGDDAKFVRCKQCGFLVNTDIISRGSGYGNEVFTDITTIAGGTANVKDPGVSGGCPFCGASEY
jgi:hypothetical protein